MNNKLRRYLYYYPTIVKMCTFDWMTLWPDDAVYSVAEKFIATMNLRNDNKESRQVEKAMDDKEKADTIDIRLNEYEKKIVNIIVHFNRTIKDEMVG